MILAITVHDNIKDVSRTLTGIERKQLPFAISNALNSVAFDARRAVLANLRKKFILRNKWTQRGLRVVKARKHNLVAWVNFERAYMVDQEEGGTRLPRGRHIAVPNQIRSDKRKRITKTKRPRAVLDRKRLAGGVGAPFKVVGAGAGKLRTGAGIYQRLTKARLPIRTLYQFETSVVVKPRLYMHRTIEGVATSNFRAHLNKAMVRALATAR